MSTRLILNTDKVRAIQGYKETPKIEHGHEWIKRSIPDFNILDDCGRWYINFDLDNPIPDILAEAVEEISHFARIPQNPHREFGVYHHETTVATVEDEVMAGEHVICVHLRGERIDHVRELLLQIKIGSVRPEDSFENEQIPSKLDLLREGIETLYHDLEGGSPSCEKSEVRTRLSELFSW